MKNDFIDYGKLFGELDFKEGDSARSVYSPAAYLADLLQLIEDYFNKEDGTWKQNGFFARRPDAKEIDLDGANTYNTLSYLTIVNELLEKNITQSSDNPEGNYQEIPYKKVLNKQSYPLNLPFNLDFKKANHLLEQLEVSWGEILKAFSQQEAYGEGTNSSEALYMATEDMGWSDEDFVSFHREKPEKDFIRDYDISSKFYLIPDDEVESLDVQQPLKALEYLEVFLKCTGISEKDLREIIYQNLSLRNNNEAEHASKFWINKGTQKGYPQIDEEKNKIVWKKVDQPDFTGDVPFKWFEKVDRFIKIKQKSDISYVDLDHILRYLPDFLPFKDAVSFIPVIKNISKTTGLSIEEVMVFAFSISTTGRGDEATPADQFNRIFNSKSSNLYKKYVSTGTDYVPPVQFAGYESLFKEEDLLLESSEDCRNHILHALRIKEADFKKIVEKVREKVDLLPTQTAFFKKGSDLESLTVLYRLKLLSKVCELSLTELLGLFDIIEADPTLRNHNFFDIFALTETKSGEAYYQYKSPYKIIFNEERFENLWLLQICFALSKWISENEISIDELRFWVSGEEKDAKAAEKAKKEKLIFLNTLLTAYKPYFLQESHFTSARFNQRDAKLILDTVQNLHYQLVSPKDNRLVLKDQSSAKQVAYDSVIDLEMINAEEFMNLQLEEKMVNKIINNLIQKSYLSEENHIIEENFPQDVAQFSIDFDFSDYQIATFNIIREQTLHSLIELGEQDVEIDLESISEMDTFIYKSDLATLGLTEAKTQALYDNLIFNQVITKEGVLIAPYMFAFDDGLEAFEVNIGLETFSAQIYEQLAMSMKEFEQEDLILTESAFSTLGLERHEIKDLMENLVFNGYLTEKHKVVDKAGILKLTADDLLLSLAFYPKRKAILKALQDYIATFKKTYFALDSEIIQKVANKIVADRAFNALKAEYFPAGPVKTEFHSFFLEEANKPDFYVDPYFDAAASDIVFDTIAQVIKSSDRFLLNNFTLEEIGFNAEEMQVLRSLLVEMGYITHYNAIPKDQLPYFLNINNAVGFNLAGFEDYNKDVFAALHLVAKATDEAMSEIINTLNALAVIQNDTLFALFQEHFGLSADLIELIFKELYAEDDNLAHQLLLPLISSVLEKGGIIEEVEDSQFNNAYLRMRQLLSVFSKLEMDPRAAKVLMTDQDLLQKFSEKIALPKGITRIDALLETNKDTYLLFSGTQFIEYSGVDYSVKEGVQGIAKLSALLNPDQPITAAYRDESGDEWIIQGELSIVREVGKEEWEKKEKKWGLIENDFSEPKEVDFSFVDEKGRLFIFTGEQYARYTNGLPTMDAGYPKDIAGNWEKEDIEQSLPPAIVESPGSSVLAKDGKRYVFKKDKYTTSDDFTKFADVNSFWGKVKNNFVNLGQIDAAYFQDSKAVIISGDQMVEYSNDIENDGLLVDAGSPKLLDKIEPDFLKKLGGKVHAAFTDFAGNTHYFGKGQMMSVGPKPEDGNPKKINESWGKNNNSLETAGTVDAALDGLDGKIYLFSGKQYYRYSKEDYTFIDPGYPRSIAEDWGGLNRVDAATVLDGKTYLFGKDANEKDAYIRFSTRDYNKPDEDYSVENAENWWNLPFALVEEGFNTPDAIFQDFDGDTHLFLGNQFVTFNRLQRWWSEPQELASKWDSLPFQKVDAAFIGKDGNTYLFSGKQFVRYSDKNYNRIDADFPKETANLFGKVDNTIGDKNQIDAALKVISRVKDENEKITEHQHIYLFAGKQYVRYTVAEGSSKTPDFIDPGYPKLIAEDLKTEPRFTGLEIDFTKAIDGAMADHRNVYIFQGNQMHIYSDALYQTYASKLDGGVIPEFILKENGANYYYANGGWKWFGALEQPHILSKQATPALVEKFPANYIDALETILQGADGNTYIFQNGYCYNVALEKSYPTKDAWGLASNNFLTDNAVDAGFYGLDGKIYLFSGNQFISYTITEDGGTKTIPFLADANPGAVKETWGGLNHVFLSYVNEGKTYLMEKPDDSGHFRYIRYSSEDYSKPDEGFPKTADFSFWQIPQAFVDKGFNQVTAVHVEEDNLYLFNTNTFIQYNSSINQWTTVMPVERIWDDLPIGETNLNVADFEDIKTLLSGPNGELFFFSKHSFVTLKSGKADEILPVKNRWGIMHSEFISNSSKIDAAFVSYDGQTFLFSGLNYIRYSGTDYDLVDSGYPKAIAENLRSEKGFENLPESFDELIKTNGKVDAILQSGRHHILFLGSDIHIVSSKATGRRSLDFLGQHRNNLQTSNRVDAAYVNPDGDLVLFSGDQFYRYSEEDMSYVDEGYPKLIKDKLKEEEGIEVPKAFEKGIDGIIVTPDGVVLTKGSQSAKSAGGMVEEPKSITALLGNKDNAFDEKVGNIEAAFLSPDGYFYVFNGKQYVRYQNSKSEYIDDGYPRPIKDNWGDMALSFEEGINGAFVLDGVTYFTKWNEETKEGEYIRYSDDAYQQMDSIYPQKIRDRWGNWNDIHLGDLKIATKFKALLKKSGGKAESLIDFFDPDAPDREDSFTLLAGIFNWLVDEIKWLKRKNAFLPETSRFEQNMNLELVLRMDEIFSLCKRLNRKPSAIYSKLWIRLYQSTIPYPRAFSDVAETLSEILGSKKNKTEWKELETKINDYLSELKRNAMLPFVIAKDPNVENARDLLGKLLIDVEMGVEAKTSRIKELIAAAQLFMHRYFVQIEDFKTHDEDEEVAKEGLREQWRWLKNYRVWEANRKVFLYPENYVRPELRDLRTPAFDTLTNELLQGDMNDDTIAQIYKKYLDEYTEVSRLTIAGGFVYDNPENLKDKELILFGRTKTDPRRYYYRTATFIEEDNSAIWHPWEEIKIKIDADRVYPVYAFGRVFVFWWTLEKEAVEPEKATVEVSQTSSRTQSAQNSGKNVRSVIKIYYSFYNLNKEWSTPQLLDQKIVELRSSAQVDSLTKKEYVTNIGDRRDIKYNRTSAETTILEETIKLYVAKREEVEGKENESILIQCKYDVDQVNKYASEEFDFIYFRDFYFSENSHIKIPYKHEKRVLDHETRSKNLGEYRSFVLWPELYTDDKTKELAKPPGERANAWYNEIFSEPGDRPSDKRAVHLNKVDSAPTDLWVSYDHKGGSFLIRSKTQGDGTNIQLPGKNALLNENINRIDAAFHLNKQNHYFSGDQYYKNNTDLKKNQGVPIGAVWGRYGGAFSDTQEIAAAWLQDGTAYLIANGKKYSYSQDEYGSAYSKEEVYSGSTGLTAAFHNSEAKKLYHFYNNAYTINGGKNVLKSIKETWGFRLERTGKAGWTFQVNGDTFLFLGGLFLPQVAGDYRYAKITKNEVGRSLSLNLKIPTLENIANDIDITNFDVFIKNTSFRTTSKTIMPAGKDRRVLGGYLDAKGEGMFLVEGVDHHHVINVKKSDGKLIFEDVGEQATSQSFRFAYSYNNALIGFSAKGNPATGIILLDGEQKKEDLKSGISGIIKDEVNRQYIVFAGLTYQTLPFKNGESASQFIDRLAAIDWSVAPMISDMGDTLHASNWDDESSFSSKRIESKISSDGKVDAAWYKDGKLYMSRGDDYVVYSTDDYSQIDLGYPKKLSTNVEGLPKFTIGAAFTGADKLTYYFNNKNSTWVHSNDLTRTDQKIKAWGEREENKQQNINDVDGAYCVGNAVYLFAGEKLYKHTANSSGTTFTLNDDYPIDIPKHITAACVLDNKVFLFAGGSFKKIDNPTALNLADFAGNWMDINTGLKNIHKDFETGFDAALNDLDKKEIYLFKGNQVITFEDKPGEGNHRIKERPAGERYYEITRLTSGTGKTLNKKLFAGGIDVLLSLDTQSVDESPTFARIQEDDKRPVEKQDQIIVKKKSDVNVELPISSHLDFNSANGIYYWEIFYHVPLLIAQTYNNLQKFDEANRWYGFVFNPMQIGEYWRFMPFLNVDVGAIIDSITSSVEQLEEVKAPNIAEVKTAIGMDGTDQKLMARLKVLDQAVINNKVDSETMKKVFDLGGSEEAGFFDNLDSLREVLNNLTVSMDGSGKEEKNVSNRIIKRERAQLLELSYVLEKLQARVMNLSSNQAEIRAYLNDPFDPHSIAKIRKVAYRKAVVMSYIDNLLDWGDMLFRQYTMESINEARMHYILAYDLLGQKPENVGRLLLPETQKFDDLKHIEEAYDFNMLSGDVSQPNSGNYFYIPENDNFMDYWKRVEDRLFKIRQSLNILGIKQALPLFQPPIDPMALVNAVAGGGGLAAALAGGQMKVPHYRFTFMLEQAKQLADKVNQFGNDLLSNLEKRDSEVLSLMQTNQEGEILDLTIKVNQAQIEEAEFNLLSAEENLNEARARQEHYVNLIDDGLIAHEHAHIGLMITSNVLNAASGVLKIGSALAYAFPKVDVGPFKMGIQVGGDMVANGLDKISEAIQGVAQVTSLTGEIIGVYASHERQKQDWKLQLKTAESNIIQFEHQIAAAKLQKDMAGYQMDILKKQIKHNQDVADFYRSKFTNQQLYSWMVSQLSAIYYQTYKNAFDLAKSAEKAFQFERGIKESEATFIGGGYWDSQRKGLLAGDKLNLDLQRMEKSFYETDKRAFEIKKEVSLFAIDPVALVKLKQNRTCEFSLTEALFNYDFQGHYRRQIKSVGVTFEAGDETLSSVNATLTQLNSKIIMEPDIKAVKYLMDPQGEMPTSIRGNWRSSQQVVLSMGDQYSGVDNGLFEMRFDDQRYLPFEGTGAVSDWRLDLSGLREDFDLKEITDVRITINYTAYQGGELFGGEVKSTLKPYLSAQMVNVATGFPNAWKNFLVSEDDELKLNLQPSMFPNIRGNKIDGILCKYELFEPGSMGLMLKEQDGQELTDGNLMATSGLKLPRDGATWTFVLNGDKANLKNVELIFTYQAVLR